MGRALWRLGSGGQASITFTSGKRTPALDHSSAEVLYLMAAGAVRREATMGCGQMLLCLFCRGRRFGLRYRLLCRPLAKVV